MNEAPKKIWLDSDMTAWKQYSEDDTPYIHPAPEATQGEEPIGYVVTIDPSKSYRQDSWAPWKEVEGMNGGKIRDDIPDGSFVYLHPAPRPEFVRLSEEEMTEILTSAYDIYAAICAVENRLVEKNK